MHTVYYPNGPINTIQQYLKGAVLPLFAFGHYLQAGPAGCYGFQQLKLIGFSGYRHGNNWVVSVAGTPMEQRHPFGTKPGRVSHIFLVAGMDNFATFQQQGRPYFKFRVWRVRACQCANGFQAKVMIISIQFLN